VESFQTILIAFACSRLIFAGQYMTSESLITYTSWSIADRKWLGWVGGQNETFADTFGPSSPL
jgi:hypothetical protein